jgi:hypothetical protein
MNTEKLKASYARASAWALPVLVVLLIFSLRECGKRADLAGDLKLNLDSVARLAKSFENKNGVLVSENKQLTVESGTQLEALTDSIFALRTREAKNIRTVADYARIIQEGKFRDKLGTWTDTLTVTDTNYVNVELDADTNYLRIPKAFSYEDSTIAFSGSVTRAGVHMDSVGISNTVHFRTVVNRSGFLNLGKSTTVQAINTNPGITTTGLTSLTVRHKSTAWQRWIKPTLAAALAAVATYQIAK